MIDSTFTGMLKLRLYFLYELFKLTEQWIVS